MLTPKLNTCTECNSIPNLLFVIDCKLTEMANKQYNNIVFGLNKLIPEDIMLDLLNYKRILTSRYCNKEYACQYSLENIAGKVKLLTYK